MSGRNALIASSSAGGDSRGVGAKGKQTRMSKLEVEGILPEMVTLSVRARCRRKGAQRKRKGAQEHILVAESVLVTIYEQGDVGITGQSYQ